MSQLDSLPVTSRQVQRATKNDSILSRVLRYTKSGWPTQTPTELEPFKNRHAELSIEGNCLLWGIRVIIPAKLQGHVLRELHSSHSGMSRMKSLARSYVWWHNIDKDIEGIVQSCRPCLSIKHSPAVAPLHPWAWPTKPWQSGLRWSLPRKDVFHPS